MGIIANPDLWEDGAATSPPDTYEALAQDGRWWFTDQNGAYAPGADQAVIYIGDFPIGPELNFEYEVVEPASQSIRFMYHFGGEDFTEIIPNEVGTGVITVTVPGDASFFGFEISTDNPEGSFYTGTVAVGEYVEEEEESPEGKYYRVEYLPVEEFVNLVNARNPNDDNVITSVYGPDDVRMSIYTDRPPTYWTSIDDEYVIFDSYDSTEESTITPAKTEVYVSKSSLFVLEDDQVIDLPSNLMPYLQAQVESRAFAYFKQAPNPKSEQRERRYRVRSQRSKWRHQRLIHKNPDYGRR